MGGGSRRAVRIASEAQVVRYIDGIFVAPRTGAPVELIAYAEQTSVGRLRMAEGTLADAPLIHEAVSVLASLSHWKPIGAFITTTHLFQGRARGATEYVVCDLKSERLCAGLRVVDLESANASRTSSGPSARRTTIQAMRSS